MRQPWGVCTDVRVGNGQGKPCWSSCSTAAAAALAHLPYTPRRSANGLSALLSVAAWHQNWSVVALTAHGHTKRRPDGPVRSPLVFPALQRPTHHASLVVGSLFPATGTGRHAQEQLLSTGWLSTLCVTAHAAAQAAYSACAPLRGTAPGANDSRTAPQARAAAAAFFRSASSSLYGRSS